MKGGEKMKPPKEAIKKIKEYCEKTNCAKCNYGQIYDQNMIACSLVDTIPVYWETGEENVKTNST